MFHNRQYGTNLSLRGNDFESEYWGYFPRLLNKELGISELEGERRFKHFLSDDAHTKHQPIAKDAIRAVNELRTRFRLEVITARDQSMKEDTVKWLNKSLPDVFHGVHFATNGRQARAKAEICKEIGAEYLIDDSVSHCNTAAAEGISAILFGNYGWNSNQELHPDVVRLPDWDAVLDFFAQKH